MSHSKSKIIVIGLAFFALLGMAMTGIASSGPKCTGTTQVGECPIGKPSCSIYYMKQGDNYYQCQAAASGKCNGVATICKKS